ncbi:hypothetical protein C0J50_3856 [Silurus asotus]|uniref:Reverse transcriptase domain-containing protein n=1 Tax=Silurus asotus TaxID=30991 RepID=A0AAD5ADS4_SILAS|nr:hypothetical protein C0J50_3856 [Silurus asotus]
MESQRITVSRSVSRRGAKRFSVEISKARSGGGGDVFDRGLACLFRCCRIQGPCCTFAGVVGALGLGRETRGVKPPSPTPPFVMKCFERLVMRHIKTQLPPFLDPMQFVYRPNRSTDDAIFTTLHLALTHLDNKDLYVRMLFIDFSSAFNRIIPQHLIEKLNLLGLNASLCNLILDFLTGRPQSVRIGNSISSTTTLGTGAPQGCVLSPLLFTLLTRNCVAMHSSNHIIKFADDMIVVGLISKNDESAYREEVQRLTAWCGANNLSLNVDKTKEIVVDFRRAQSDQSPLIIDGSSVEIVKSTKFLGVHLADNLTWSLNTSSITKKAQQHLFFLRRLRKTHLSMVPCSTEGPLRAS